MQYLYRRCFMAYKGVMEDVRKCIGLQKPDRVPVFACSEEFDVRMTGEVYSNYNSNSEVMAKCQIEAIKRFNYDWAWLQVDDCIEFEPLGVGVKSDGNILPATCEYLPASYHTDRDNKVLLLLLQVL
jgi:uroporphyrinogen-III decarboxylase